MRLYHFTARKNLDSILDRGLVPAVGKNAAPELTLGLPVVWLTSKPAPTWMVGCPEDLCMLTVNVKRGKHLHHWRTWIAGARGKALDDCGKPYYVDGSEVLHILDTHMEPTPLAPNPAA